MSLNQTAWEREYQNPKLLITANEKPHAELVKFLKWLRRSAKGAAPAEPGGQGPASGWKEDVSNWQVLDLGSGTGRNANFLAERGMQVTGFEYAKNALALAKQRAVENNLTVDYQLQDIGASYPIADQSIDLILDLTSSNSLNNSAREVYLQEVKRVLKPGGYILVRSLAKDGDKNAKWLLANHPGLETDTYVLPEVGITERVFSRADFNLLYGQIGQIEKLELTSHYTKLNGRIFKRNFWVGYIKNFD